ncbi:cuticle protein AMP4-like [Penaeus japonicus]|uniref:cuticle protein AMP4-like n=1 Tax=Penaeus japonicus TaxID=27405 RepID=UPI001C71769C|nr:cuticle protein AMP4-like [Penaeus japonicus]
MKLIIVAMVMGVALAQDVKSLDERPLVAIVRNVQSAPDETGAHSSDFEAENGIRFQLSGSQGLEGGANMVGAYSYPMEDGTLAEVTFVADEKGYQPDSSLLPVAPAFPHPIPEYVLKQIEFARQQEEAEARGEAVRRQDN